MVGIINLALYFIEFEMASWGTKQAAGYAVWHSKKKAEIEILVCKH